MTDCRGIVGSSRSQSSRQYNLYDYIPLIPLVEGRRPEAVLMAERDAAPAGVVRSHALGRGLGSRLADLRFDLREEA